MPLASASLQSRDASCTVEPNMSLWSSTGKRSSNSLFALELSRGMLGRAKRRAAATAAFTPEVVAELAKRPRCGPLCDHRKSAVRLVGRREVESTTARETTH